MIEIESRPNCITEIEAFVKKITSKYQIGEEQYPDILVSLTEAVNNAMIHGNRMNACKKIQISYSVFNKQISFIVSHQGEGFDPAYIADPTLVENRGKTGGRGIYLMRNLCKKLEYSNQGKTVEMVFNLR